MIFIIYFKACSFFLLTIRGETLVLRLGDVTVCPTKRAWPKSFPTDEHFNFLTTITFSIRDTPIFSKFARRNCMAIPDEIETGGVGGGGVTPS